MVNKTKNEGGHVRDKQDKQVNDVMFPDWDFTNPITNPNKPTKKTEIYHVDPASAPAAKDFGPLVTPEEEAALKTLYESPCLKSSPPTINGQSIYMFGTGLESKPDLVETWIQTHSGRRFNPTNPNPNSIVIQDIAHALSMQCRFSGHCSEFYSVAQHSVLVSHICNFEDALWGLLHDASEAYLVDVPRPLKRSGKFQAYIDFETAMTEAVCKRFGLPFKEPPSVKRADTILLATEARDLMSPRHPDWVQPVEPLPFKIESWGPKKAKDMFMKRFFELTGAGPEQYEHYLKYNL